MLLKQKGSTNQTRSVANFGLACNAGRTAGDKEGASLDIDEHLADKIGGELSLSPDIECLKKVNRWIRDRSRVLSTSQLLLLTMI